MPGGCTGFYISQQGHLLTAAHCVELSRASRRSVAGIPATEHDDDVAFYGPGSGEISIDGHSAYLIMAGRGYPDFALANGNPTDMARLRRLMLGDWALVKVSHSAPTPCVVMEETALPAGAPVWNAGYPTAAARGGLDDIHRRPLATDGQALDPRRLANAFGQLPADRVRPNAELYEPMLDAGHALLSDVDSNGGMSGGPIFDQLGRVAALQTMARSDAADYVPYSTFGVTTKKIFEDLRSVGVDPAAYFHCR